MAYQGGVQTFTFTSAASGATDAALLAGQLYDASNMLLVVTSGGYQLDLAAVGVIITAVPDTTAPVLTLKRAPRVTSLGTNPETIGTITVPLTVSIGDVVVRYNFGTGTTLLAPGEAWFLTVTTASSSTGLCVPFLHATGGRYGSAATSASTAKVGTSAEGSVKVVAA